MPPSSTIATLSINLAATLAAGPWDAPALTARLAARLPQRLRQRAAGLAQDLMTAFPVSVAPAPGRIATELRQLPRFGALCEALKGTPLPAPDRTAAHMHPVPTLQNLPLPELPDLHRLTDWLQLTPAQLAYFADRSGRHARHEEAAVNHYRTHLIPKSRGGHRLLEAPKVRLKALQRQILHGILAHLPAHADAFGFTPGRGAASAANRHVGEAMVLSFDLAEFFPSVTAARVHGIFRCLGYPHAVAQALTALATTVTPEPVLARLAPRARTLYRAPHLPQGAPTSPALASQAAFTLDRRLAGLARSLGANYSRYADDFSFSGDRKIRPPLQHAVPRIVEEEGFALNPDKTRAAGRGQRQVVTGICVNARLNTPRASYEQLKAELHAMARPDDPRLDDPAERARIAGRIAWVAHLNPARGEKLYARLDTAFLAHRTSRAS